MLATVYLSPQSAWRSRRSTSSTLALTSDPVTIRRFRWRCFDALNLVSRCWQRLRRCHQGCWLLRLLRARLRSECWARHVSRWNQSALLPLPRAVGQTCLKPVHLQRLLLAATRRCLKRRSLPWLLAEAHAHSDSLLAASSHLNIATIDRDETLRGDLSPARSGFCTTPFSASDRDPLTWSYVQLAGPIKTCSSSPAARPFSVHHLLRVASSASFEGSMIGHG